MAFTVTARQSGNAGQTGGTSLATDSATPTANSLLLVGSVCENDNNSVAPTFATPTGGGWTYTQVTTIGTDTITWDGSAQFRIHAALYRADVGGSPSTHTVTVDHGTDGFYCAVCADITGHDDVSPVVQAAQNGADGGAGNSVTGTVTFGSALTSGNLVVVTLGAGADGGGGFAAPTLGGQSMTQVFNQNDSWTQTGMWYRVIDGTETDGTITCTDMGDTVGNWTMLAVEVAAGASTGTDGSAAGSYGYSGTATGQATVLGAADGSYSYTGTAGGQATAIGSAAGSYGYSGALSGQATAIGSAEGSYAYTGAAQGQATVIGSVAGSYGYAGTASGAVAGTGSASGSYGFSGTAEGQTTVIGSTSGSFGYSGTAAGTGASTAPEPIVLPTFREPAVPDYMEATVPSFRERSVPAFQEAT